MVAVAMIIGDGSPVFGDAAIKLCGARVVVVMSVA